MQHISHRVAIMYLGRIVELAESVELYRTPRHPYTQFLIDSLPHFGDKTMRSSCPGSPPSLANLPAGCPFHPRCPFVKEICTQAMPTMVDLTSDHKVACWLVGER